MTKTVNMGEFASFIADQRAKINDTFKEVEQVQSEFQGMYTRFRDEHDKTLQALVSRFETQDDGLGKTFRAQVDARVPDERQAIVKRIAELESQIPKLQKQADDMLARAQKEMTDLREMNPKLNAREETLKANLAKQQQRLDALNQQVSQLAGCLGFVFNAWKIHSLDRERFQALGRIEALSEELRKVRQEWKELHEMVTQNETKWQSEWRTAMAKIGQLRQERDYLTQNTDAEARRRAITFVLDNLKALPDDADAAPLKPMVDLNIQTDNFQAALGSVAGILGISRSMDEGLGRMGESVNAIIAEQNRHSQYLRPPSIVLPDRAVEFGKTWDELIAKTKDEKTLAKHPADFVAAMKSFLNERLSDSQITEFFNALGGALQGATKGWRGS